MDLIELLKKRENYDDLKAQKKLSLFYDKAHASGFDTFIDEFFEWLMVNKNLSYKDIFKYSDHELHDLYFDEFKKFVFI